MIVFHSTGGRARGGGGLGGGGGGGGGGKKGGGGMMIMALMMGKIFTIVKSFILNGQSNLYCMSHRQVK